MAKKKLLKIGRVPRTELSTRTKANLRKLERKGFKFNKTAEQRVVSQYFSSGEPAGRAKSLSIKGKDSKGKKITYHRRETRAKGAGQTFLSTPAGKIQVSAILNKSVITTFRGKGTSQTNPKAAVHYGLKVKELS